MAVVTTRPLVAGAILLAGAVGTWLALTGTEPAPPPGEDEKRRVAAATGDGETAGPPGETDVDPESGGSEAIVVSGTVVDPRGRAVPGARVHLVRPVATDGPAVRLPGELEAALAREPDVVADARSDEEGVFALEDLPAGSFVVEARAEGHATERIDVRLAEGASLDALRVVLERGVELRGRVRSSDRTPLAGKTVVASPDRPYDPLSTSRPTVAKTDEEGRFVLAGLRARVYLVRVLHRGSVLWNRSVLPGVDGPLDVILSGGARLEGTVRDELGAAVAGARVVAREVVTTTDEGGRYAFDDLAPGPLTKVRVVKPGFAAHPTGRARYWSDASDDLWLEAGRTAVYDVVLGRGATVRGRVVRSTDGRPCAGVEVIAQGWMMMIGDLPRARTDEEGWFRIEGLDVRPWFLVPKVEGFGSEGLYAVFAEYDKKARERLAIDVRPGDEELTASVRVEPWATLMGAVRSAEGEPVPGASVTARWRKNRYFERALGLSAEPVTADAQGRFRMAVYPGATVVVEAKFDGRTARSDPVETAAGESVEGLELTLAAPRSVSGRVVDEEGRPLAGVVVRATEASSRPVVGEPVHRLGWELHNDLRHAVGTTTDRRGTFEIDGLPPVPIVVRAETRDRQPEPARVDLTEGDRDGLRLALRPGLTIRGLVTDESDEPIAGASVFAEPPDALPAPYVVTRGDGRFEVRRLPPGRYRVGARAGGFTDGGVDGVPAGTADVRITLVRLETVSGRVVDAEGGPVAAAHVYARDSKGEGQHDRGRTKDDGTFRLARGPPGEPCVIEVRPPGGGAAVRRTVEPGARDVEITLE